MKPNCSSVYRAEFMRCAHGAALAMGMSDKMVATVVSYFLEEMAKSVANGKIVSLPGIGLMGTLTYYSHLDRIPPRVYPAFSGSNPFRQLVKQHCKPHTCTMDVIKNHRKYVHSQPQVSERPSRALHKFRAQLRNLALKEGLPLLTPKERIAGRR